MKTRIIAIVGGCLLACVPAESATGTIKSQWASSHQQVDGVITDFTDLTAVTNQVTVGAANDGDRIFLAIATSDAKVKLRLITAGLIIYLDAKGKNAKTFGVRIPPLRRAFGPDLPAGSEAATTYIEVIGPGENEVRIVDLVRPMGFAVASSDNRGTLLIELSLPLRATADTPYALQLRASQAVLGIGLVTPEPPPQRRGGPGGRGGGGGISVGGYGPGGYGGGGYGGGMPGGGPGELKSKALKVWTTIALAKPQGPIESSACPCR